MREKDGQFQLLAAVAGLDAKDGEIEVTPEDILLKANVAHKHTQEKGVVHTCEFQGGNLFRAIHLPKKIDPDQVKAEFKNGMLTVTAAIAEEAERRTIPVQAA